MDVVALMERKKTGTGSKRAGDFIQIRRGRYTTKNKKLVSIVIHKKWKNISGLENSERRSN